MRATLFVLLLVLGSVAGCLGTDGPLDSDGDGISDADEATLGTDPGQADTDGDGVDDGDEVKEGTDPNRPAGGDGPVGTAPIQVRTPVRLGSAPGEPNIAVASDGTLYVSSPIALWRSSDGGATWTAAAHQGVSGGGDADIAVDGSGNLYWLGLGGGDGPIPFFASSDLGETFGPGFDVSDGSGADREWIDATDDGRIYTTWRGDDLEFRASFDGGATWQPKVRLGPDGNQGPLSHDPATGFLYNTVADFPPIAGDADVNIHLYRSEDEGATWTDHIITTLAKDLPAENNGYVTDFTGNAVDSAGNVYAVWSGDSGFAPVVVPRAVAVYGTWMAVSKDHGDTWGAPVLLSDPSKDAVMPWIAAGADGRVAVVWYEGVNGVPGESLPDQWHVKMWISTDATSVSPAGSTVTLTDAPNHLGAVCTSGTGCLASDRSLLDFFEVVITPEGLPVATWTASSLGTGVGVAVDGPFVEFGGLADGPRLR